MTCMMTSKIKETSLSLKPTNSITLRYTVDISHTNTIPIGVLETLEIIGRRWIYTKQIHHKQQAMERCCEHCVKSQAHPQAQASQTQTQMQTEGYPIDHPRRLIPELCRQFYTLKWVTGTGGGISMKYGNEYYLAPSGVQKERIQAEDLFVVRPMALHSKSEEDLLQQQRKTLEIFPLVSNPLLYIIDSPPPEKKFTASQCSPLFFAAFSERNAGACIHTHSQAAMLVTLLYDKEFTITHQEMIKGIKIGSTGKNLSYYDECVVPIIENTPEEKDLTSRMLEVIAKYPHTNAVLVRRHGVYVWGENWQKAKIMCECYDYLFEIAIQMKQIGVDPSHAPENSDYKSVMKKYGAEN